MSRNSETLKKKIYVDKYYKSFLVHLLIQGILKKGKKNLAIKIIYKTFQYIEEQTKSNSLKLFEQALFNTKFLFEFKVNSSSEQIPYEMNSFKSILLAIKNLVLCAKKNTSRTFSLKLANEIIGAANGLGLLVKNAKENRFLAKTYKSLLNSDSL